MSMAKIVITKTTPLKRVLELGKACNMCGFCCRHTSGFLAREDLQKIAEHLKITKDELKEKYLEEAEKFNTKLWRPKTASTNQSNQPNQPAAEQLKSPHFKSNKFHGPCVFFSGKGCRIHNVKPLHCRITSCKEHGEELDLWFTLNYIVNENDPESIRQFDAYIRSGGKTLEGGRVEDFVKDKERLRKILSFEILR